MLPDGTMISPDNRTCFQSRDEFGGIRLSDLVLLAVVIVGGSFFDWGGVLEKFSFGSTGPLKAALTQLDCELEVVGVTNYVRTVGAVRNTSEEPLRLSVRVDYASNGRIFGGRRTIEQVQPTPLSPNAIGTFALRESVQFPPSPEVGCLIQFYENDIHNPIQFEDRT